MLDALLPDDRRERSRCRDSVVGFIALVGVICFVIGIVFPAITALTGELSPPPPNAVCHIRASDVDRVDILAPHGHAIGALSIRYDACTADTCHHNRMEQVVLMGPTPANIHYRVMRDYYVGRHSACYVEEMGMSWTPFDDRYLNMRIVASGAFIFAASAFLLTLCVALPLVYRT